MAEASSTASSSASAAVSSAHGIVGQSPTFKIVGVVLAVGSGLFIGSSFVIKKMGLKKSTEKHGNKPGEGHGYLKSWLWWTGMTLMVIGEILNFVAYAFTVAILVAPMGAVSVVVAAILSHFFLKESLSFFGWIGCILCIIGSIILAINAPSEQSVRTIREFMAYFISPGFMVWTSICVIASLVIVFYVAPRWGKKNMMPYISVCSLIGGISVSCTQGLGSAIVTSIQGDNQVKHWFFWFLLAFVIITLLIEINYLNKALELFNTSMVVPVYFCYFTSATMISSFILYRGLKAPATTLITMVLGFLVTCFGITLLQMSKVDPKQLTGLDRRSTMLLAASRHPTEAEEKGEVESGEEPGMDALRGGYGAIGSIIRARSIARRMSTASATNAPYGTGYASGANLSTHGLGNLARYQLSDNPMPDDSEHIPMSPTLRKDSALKFESSDVVHQYGYTSHDRHSEATHHLRPHDQLRQFSTASMEPVAEGVEKDYPDPYVTGPRSYSPKSSPELPKSSPGLSYVTGPRSYSPKSSPGLSAGPHHPERKTSFSQLFAGITSSPGVDVRGASHRATRDYPHLPRDDRATEREERTVLVGRESGEIYAEPESDPELGDLGQLRPDTQQQGRQDKPRPKGPR